MQTFLLNVFCACYLSKMLIVHGNFKVIEPVRCRYVNERWILPGNYLLAIMISLS